MQVLFLCPKIGYAPATHFCSFQQVSFACLIRFWLNTNSCWTQL